MADKSKIEWTEATWNPIRGCSVVSEGCRNCYAMAVAARFSGTGQAYDGLAYRNTSGAHWTGQVRLIEEHLGDPLRWNRPRRIFVNSMSDLFHESIPDQWIDLIFAVMALAPKHTFQILTKRPQRMLRYMEALSGDRVLKAAFEFGLLVPNREHVEAYAGIIAGESWPLSNVWLGVSVEDQKTADERIPVLLQVPAAIRWISVEPLLSAIDLQAPWSALNAEYPAIGIHWVVVGGESGPGARPMHPHWVRSLHDQCLAAAVPFFFKQWGQYAPIAEILRDSNANEDVLADASFNKTVAIHIDGTVGWQTEDDPAWSNLKPYAMERVGKKSAGRLLDGREWSEYPA